MSTKQFISRSTKSYSPDGSVEEELVTAVRKVPSEPSFAKMYFDDLSALKGITKRQRDVLEELVVRMGYDNEVSLSSGLKKEICLSLGILKSDSGGELKEENVSLNGFNYIVSQLVKAELIFRKGSGLYIINPYLFGRGKWTDVEKIRMEVKYTKSGRSVKSAIEKASDRILGR